MRTSLFSIVLVVIAVLSAQAQDELAKRASWESPTLEQVQSQVKDWIAEQKVDELVGLKVTTLWEATDKEIESSKLLDQVAESIQLVDDRAKPLVMLCSNPRSKPSAPKFAVLTDEKTPAFVRNNLRLYYGRWLAQHDLYDEALEHLDGVKPDSVVDPASLLFYQGVGYHRLLKKDKCLPVLTQLLENEDVIPRRYETVASLMVADIKPLKTDSLDEISRLMSDIRRRQALYRSGKRVRKEEEDVLAKLDKLIEELEEQQKQQGGGGGGGSSGNNTQSSSPASDSANLGGKGEGNVDPKKIGRGEDWGDLPPDKRDEVLQELSKDLPAHFREVIEEYFKKLARDDPR